MSGIFSCYASENNGWEMMPRTLSCSQVRRTKNRTLGGSDQMNDWESAQPLRRRGDRMRRREFIALLGGATVCPLAARAQQGALPVVGLLTMGSAGRSYAADHRSLEKKGHV